MTMQETCYHASEYNPYIASEYLSTLKSLKSEKQRNPNMSKVVFPQQWSATIGAEDLWVDGEYDNWHSCDCCSWYGRNHCRSNRAGKISGYGPKVRIDCATATS